MEKVVQANGIPAQFSENANPVPASGASAGRASQTVLVIDTRVRDRECLIRSIAAKRADMNVMASGSFAEWNRNRDRHPPLSAVLLNIGGRSLNDPNVTEAIRKLVSECGAAPVIAMADSDELREIFQALDCGVRGYIPSTLGIAVCVEAISLVLAGGIFVPASCLASASLQTPATSTATAPQPNIFTSRQADVVEALTCGKANKIIAYELNMRESTVKVHVRNIMKKLKATNRTEVAYKVNELLHREGASLR
jgi:DNA-binding NarL/FixJ family response regulator